MNATLLLNDTSSLSTFTGSVQVKAARISSGSMGTTSMTTVTPSALRGSTLDALSSKLAEAGSSVPASLGVAVARRWAMDFDRVYAVPQKIAVSREGSVYFYFIRGRKIAALECDVDGDSVLSLSDREVEGEAEAYLVSFADAQTVLNKVAEFLGR